MPFYCFVRPPGLAVEDRFFRLRQKSKHGFLTDRSLRLRAKPDPHIQAAVLLFALRLEEEGYAENTDTLIETLRVQVPRMRALYQQHKEQLDEFWQRHPEVTALFDEPEETQTLPRPEQKSA